MIAYNNIFENIEFRLVRGMKNNLTNRERIIKMAETHKIRDGESTGVIISIETIKNDSSTIMKMMDNLTNEERAEIMHNYCYYCGEKDSGCHCENDE